MFKMLEANIFQQIKKKHTKSYSIDVNKLVNPNPSLFKTDTAHSLSKVNPKDSNNVNNSVIGNSQSNLPNLAPLLENNCQINCLNYQQLINFERIINDQQDEIRSLSKMNEYLLHTITKKEAQIMNLRKNNYKYKVQNDRYIKKEKNSQNI